MEKEDVLIIGAGPCGLSAAIECGRRGLSVRIIEKHNVVHSIYLYPTNMQFFSTAELLEIGGVPFTSPNEKPFRHEALAYYRKVSKHHDLRISSYEEALSVRPQPDGSFRVSTRDRAGNEREYEAGSVVISTGYFDHPNELGIPGEDKEKVTHYFREAHPYAGMNVAIVGGSNSAVDAALELIRVGAKIDMIYRRTEISQHIKPWVRPLFESMVEKGKITLHLGSQLTEIGEDYVIVRGPEQKNRIRNDFVLAMTGFRPDRKLLTEAGAQMSDDLDKPVFNPDTMETGVPGLYVAGVIASGRNANEVFIESGRKHGGVIAEHIAQRASKSQNRL
ncbi:YpdA family putative bacillithiol disulfide reductase [Saccharibacillus sp. CPCC 101409]|uniref:YpdA family putative bacillithiol disulfide reductase n=1 Tax=Saccharibacillus sp. CPCC 101409 TaxID=3058041 RepID=UPI002673BD9F|nr:YpdA family putative bacillithiol disulfide reductase [Saccharibacillus sp. CPCC 101409]MDO3410609.1 YpdA family putative bacillithiol disulfide reductase [Saccharibacillus sp. CPCC 101409]